MALDTLHQIFTKNADLLAQIYRDPQITAYNRLEPRARTEDFARSLRAEIRDPLWMLARQWQMGEFEAEDAGSAIDARLLTSQAQIDRVSLGGASAQPYDENIVRIQSEVHALQAHEAAHEQARADKQDQRQRDLSDDQSAPQSVSFAPRRHSAALLLE